MSPAQCKEARRLLGIPRERLAAASGVTIAVVRRYENEGYLQRVPGGETGAERLQAIRAALEVAGVEFIEQNGGGPGVRLRRKK